MNWDPAKLEADLKWLQLHPHFDEKPASVTEFLTEDYLNIERGVRPGVKQELVNIFGEVVNGERIARVRWAMFTGAIGIGKTTMASIVIPYMCHWVLCLRDPQSFYELLPGSRIAFMQMSTSEDQAKETVFGDIKARIEHAKWFQDNAPFDPKFTNQIRFPKDIWVLPGGSAETQFEGYNILGGILDEADSHKKTRDRDYAEQGWDTINSRIDSRFQDRGFLLTIGQMKKANGFAANKYKELKADSESSHTVRMTIWESRGWDKYLNPDGTRDSFWYDTKRKQIVPDAVVEIIGNDQSNLIEVPNVYRKNFENNPEKALRDLAGIPPQAGEAFISMTHKIDEAVERWIEHHPGLDSPVTDSVTRPQFEDWFIAQDSLKRLVHLDIGTSANGDAAGLVMGHVSHLVNDEDGDEKPYIVIDMMLRVHAAPGTEVLISDLRRYMYELKDKRKFRIVKVTMDGHQSTDTRQQLRKRKMNPGYLSVDKTKLPYEDLRDALYEDRIEFPPYMTYITKGSDERIQIAVKELQELEEGDRKIDHPTNGSKDVADGLAGVVTGLMGDRTYRRGVGSRSRDLTDTDQDPFGQDAQDIDGYSVGGHFIPGFGGSGLQAPIPPSSFGDVSMPIPPSLMPRRG